MNSVKRADESLAARTTNPDRNLGFRVVNAGRIVAHAASMVIVEPIKLTVKDAPTKEIKIGRSSSPVVRELSSLTLIST
jgi:hypothetical protein